MKKEEKNIHNYIGCPLICGSDGHLAAGLKQSHKWIWMMIKMKSNWKCEHQKSADSKLFFLHLNYIS